MAIFIAGLVVLSLGLINGSASAKTIKMTVAAGQPPHLLGIKFLRDYFIPEVDKRIAAAGLDFKIKWTQAYAGALCKATKCIFAVQDGITDIGFVPTIFHPDKLPLEGVGFVTPFLTDQVKIVTDVMDDLHRSIPEMGKQYEKYNQIRLAGGGIDTYHIIATFPIRSIDDVKGRKIGTAGGALAWMRGTGAVPVQSNMMLYYNSTKTGVYDGFIVFPSSYLPFKYTEVAPYVNMFNFGAQYAQAATMNKDSFAKLPPAVQKIFREVAIVYREKNDGGYQAFSAKSLKLVAKKPGVTLVKISDKERRRWAMAMPNLAKEWVQQREKQGLPGKKVLTAYMNGVRKAGVKPIRNWDKE
jgi:TRAP-type C4-dicarboxylate transport system substrate-binding protein